MAGFMAGAIVSKLTLDKSQWSQSISSVKKDEKTMGGMSTRMAGGFKKMGTAMTVAGAAIVASLGLMVKKYVAAGDEVHKMALRTGFATETLSELRYAAQIAGTDIGDLEKGVKKMQKTIVDAGSGLMTYVRSFDRIGVSIEELEGLNPEEQFMKISYAIADMEDPTLRAATAQEIFGRAGTKLLPLFAEGSAGMEKLREEARELGYVFDQEAADKAARLADAQTKLKTALAKVSSTIVETLVPHLSKLVEGLSKTIAKIGDWIKAHPGLTGAIVKFVAILGGVLTILGPILILLPKLIAGLALLKGAFLALLGPIGLVAAAATAAIVIFNQLKKAKEYLAEATDRADASEKRLMDKLKRAADAAGMTRAEFHQLSLKYGENAAALSVAIRRGEESVELQKALADEGKKGKAAWDEQQKSVKGITKAQGIYNTVIKKTPGLIKTMVDEVKKLTLDEYTYRKEKAMEIYEERKAILEQESADAEAFAILEKSLTLELADIEKDRTEAFKEQQKEKKEAEEERVEKQRQLYETAEGFISGYTDTVNQLTMDEMEYKIWALDEWYKKELQTLKDSLGNTELYVKAKEALDEAFAARSLELSKSTTEEISRHWQMVCDGLGNAFGGFIETMLAGGTTLKDGLKNLWDDVKGTFVGVIGDMAREWMTGFIKNLITGAVQAGTSITTSLGASITTLTTGLGSLVGAIGQALVAIAQAIATAATILASAAAALVTVGLVAIALYAAFSLVEGIVNSLLGGGPEGGDIVYWLKAIREVGERISWGTDSLGEIRNFTYRLLKVCSLLKEISKSTAKTASNCADIVRAIGGIGGAQEGEYIPRPSLRRVAEKVPEIIAPVPEIQQMVESAAERGTRVVVPPVSKQVELVQNVNINYELRDMIDGESVRKLVREKVLPETIESLKINYKGMLSEAKKALSQ